MHFDFQGYKTRDRWNNHMQGMTYLDTSRWLLSRNDAQSGSIYVTNARRVVDRLPCEFAHIGGLDSAGGFAVAPGYLNKQNGALFFDTRGQFLKQVGEYYTTGHRAYAAGMVQLDEDVFLVCFVTEPNGSGMSFYLWDRHTLTHIYDQFYLECELKEVSKNNITLMRDNNDNLVLFLMRGHLGGETVTCYGVKLHEDSGHISFFGKQQWEFGRRGLCSARFASTMVRLGDRYLFYRTQRNVFWGRLRYKKNELYRCRNY